MDNTTKWVVMPHGSERATIGKFCCEAWIAFDREGVHARYSVFDTALGWYVKDGRCASLEWARDVSANFARSLGDVE